MGTFLQILLAVVVVIAAIALSGWVWLRSKIKKYSGDVEAAFKIIPPMYMEPARLHLHRSDGDECSRELGALSGELRSLGFQRIADLQELSSGYGMLRALRHRELPIAATITETQDCEICFSLFTVTADRCVFARSNGSRKSMQNSRLDWQVSTEVSLDTAFQDICSHVSETNLNVSLGLTQSVVEQVHALRIDEFIVDPPTRESIERYALKLEDRVDDDQIDRAHEFAMDYWEQQINESVLDRYRRTSKIDAVAWEDIRDQVLVVHDHLSNDDIESFLVFDELSESLFEQLKSQNLKGIALFCAVVDRLPKDAQWRKIAEVEKPVFAQVFSRDAAIESDERTSHQYVYEADDESGKRTAGAIYATSSADAKKQITTLGLENAKVLISPAPGDGNLDQFVFDDRAAEIAARSTREGLGKSLFRIVIANWWVWMPPAYLLWRTLSEGAPYGWGDYVVIGYSAVAGIALTFLVGPTFFYNRLLHARLLVQPKRARFFLSLLKPMGAASGMTQSQLLCEHCRILAMEGRLGDALSALENKRSEFGEEEYQSSLVQVYDAAGCWPEMIAAQRAVLADSSIESTANLDLAMSIARYADEAGEADAIIQAISPDDLSEIELIGFEYVAGLLAARRDDYDAALLHYASANESASQFASLPIMQGLIAEINAYAAVALRRRGMREEAQSVWEKVWPILKRHHSAKLLLASYESR